MKQARVLARRLSPIVVPAAIICGFAMSGLTAAGASDAGPRARSSKGGESIEQKVDRFQREILASINCEEIALNPQLSDALARDWMDCAISSLNDAEDLAGQIFDQPGFNQSKEDIHSALFHDHKALRGFGPVNKAEIRDALARKKLVVKVVYPHAEVRPKPSKKGARCSFTIGPGSTSGELRSFFDYGVKCDKKITDIVVIPPPERPPDTSVPPIWFVNPNGPQRGCTTGSKARSAAQFLDYEVACRVKGEAKDATVQVKATTPPQNGDLAVVGVTTSNHRVAFEVVSFQFGPQQQSCSGTAQTTAGPPPPPYRYQFSNTCTLDSHSISWTLPAGKQYVGFTAPAGQTGAVSSANGGINNVLTLTPASGLNPANTAVTVPVQVNPSALAAGEVTANVDGFIYMPPVS